MKFLIPASAVILSACGGNTEDKNAFESRLERDRIEFPAGRYAMLPAQDIEGVYILDTTDGSVRLCRSRESEGGMVCGPSSPQ